MPFLLLLLLQNASATSDCMIYHQASELESSLTQAERALREMKPDTFERAIGEVDAFLPCTARLPAPLLVRVHWVKAVYSYMNDENAQSLESMLAVKELSSGDDFPGQDTFPSDHPLSQAYAQLKAEPSSRRVGYPKHGALWIDTEKSAFRPQLPSHRASLLYVDKPELGAPSNYYHYANEPTPLYKTRANPWAMPWIGCSAISLAAAGLSFKTLYSTSKEAKSRRALNLPINSALIAQNRQAFKRSLKRSSVAGVCGAISVRLLTVAR